LDIISLDIDGNDFWVAEQLDMADIRIFVVEYQPLFGADRAVSIPRQDDFDRTTAHYSWLYYGASLQAFVGLMASRGLTFVGSNRAGNNAFFVADQWVDRVGLPIPDRADLSPYINWRVREAHDQSGRLTFQSAREAAHQIADLPLVDVTDGTTTTVGAVIGS
jgi:hypothetical protein